MWKSAGDSIISLVISGCLWITVLGSLLGCGALFLVQFAFGDNGILIFVGLVVALIIATIPVAYFLVKRP